MSSNKHWGEFTESEPPEPIPDVSSDIERSMNKFFLSDLESDEEAPRTERITVPPLNPMVSYGISLHKYANNLIETIKLRELINDMKIQPPPDEGLVMPKMPEIKILHKKNCLNYLPKDFTDFSRGVGIEIPDLSSSATQKILTKCTATVLAHSGYETSEQGALDVVADVLEDFLKKITLKYKIAVEDEKKNFQGFPNSIERVLTEMGFGGVKGLHDFYQARIYKYVHVLQARCRELDKEYQALIIPSSPTPTDTFNKDGRIKTEREDDVIEVETQQDVQFFALDGDVNYSLLEAGYQPLLEPESNLQTVSGEEEIHSTESPSVASLSESDVSHLSPFSKKRQLK